MVECNVGGENVVGCSKYKKVQSILKIRLKKTGLS